MGIELKKEMISINETVLRDSMQVLVQSDIIVPDIKSDMAKILQIDSKAMCEDVVVSDGAADVSGKVNLNILYVPEGDTKPVCSINTTVPFASRIENRCFSQASKCIVSAQGCHVEFSMINSRKLSVKIVVELDIRCIKEKSSELVCDVMSDIDIEKNMGSFDIYNLVYAGKSKIALSETLDFPQGKPSAASLLKADAKICDKEIRIITGKVVVRGNINVCTLYVSEDNTIEFMEHEIPFTEVLEADGASENSLCDAELEICSVDYTLRPDTDGDMRLVDISVMMEATLNISQKSNLSAIDDCFCSQYELVCEGAPFCVDTLVGMGKVQESLRGVMSFAENEPELVSVYNLIAEPYITNVDAQKDKAVVSGVIDCCILYLSASASAPVCTKKTQLAFEIPVDIEGMDEKCDCDINIDILHQSYNLTMTGEIEVRMSVELDAKAIRENAISLIGDVYINEDGEKMCRKGMVIYFVQPGDSLWKIAKRYRVPVGAVAKINGLENPDVLNVGQRLLIPACSR